MGQSDLTCGSLTLKYLVFFFNLLFFICGAALVILSIIAVGLFKDYIPFLSDSPVNLITGVIILGVIVMLISFFGCCGAHNENVCMLRFFGFLMAVILVCELVGGIAVAVQKNQVASIIKSNMNETMHEYVSGSPEMEAWDQLQHMSCCGVNNYTDWSTTTYGVTYKGVPDSCCKVDTVGCGKNVFADPSLIANINTKGCAEMLKDIAVNELSSIISAVVVLVLVQIVGLLMSCSLAKSVKAQYEAL